MEITITFTPEAAQTVMAALRREARMWGAMTAGCDICTEVADLLQDELERALRDAEEGKPVPMPTPPHSMGY